MDDYKEPLSSKASRLVLMAITIGVAVVFIIKYIIIIARLLGYFDTPN